MNDNPSITRIDQNDPRSKAALAAEQRLFAHYGLDYQSHFIEMNEPDLRLRVLEVGQGPAVLMVPGGAGDAFMGSLAAGLSKLGWELSRVGEVLPQAAADATSRCGHWGART